MTERALEYLRQTPPESVCSRARVSAISRAIVKQAGEELRHSAVADFFMTAPANENRTCVTCQINWLGGRRWQSL